MSESSFVPKCRFNLKMKKIVALLFTVALMATAHAQTPAQFAALQAQVVALQKQVTTLNRIKRWRLRPLFPLILTRKTVFAGRISPFTALMSIL